MASHDEEHLNHAPLRGVVLSCTSIPPEERHSMAQIAEQMGATHKLDLTSDITHLIVGNIDTPKYKYTARERPDIKVLHPSWLDAVRTSWMEGGEVDVAALEVEHRLPTLFGLQICVTGFDDMDQRSDIQMKVANNGAQYHGDLTKAVTHLIAAHPTGSKYEYAGRWRIKIVTIEWLRDSLERGMALDESLYHPLMPAEQRGVGAVNRKMTSPSLGKRTRQDTQSGGSTEGGRRKLRRTASTRLESQNDDLWADMGKEDESFVSAQNDQSIDKSKGSTLTLDGEPVENAHNSAHLQSFRQPLSRSSSRPTSAGHLEGGESRTLSNSIFNPTGGVDTGVRLYVHGFDERKTGILHNFLLANGANLLSEEDMRNRTGLHDDPITIVVPHDISHSDLEDVQSELFYGEDDQCVNDFWVEKCLHHKTLLDRNNVQCQTFQTFPIIGFEKFTICPTSFAGIELLHLSKIVKLMGATYDEFLKKETSVLVCNTTALNQEKLKYALDNSIPIVSSQWLWSCIATGSISSFQAFGLSGSRYTQNSTQPTFYHPESNPRPKPQQKRNETSNNKPVRSASGRPIRHQLEFSSEPVSKPLRQGGKSDQPSYRQGDDNDFAPRQQTSQQLQELPIETNSPRKSSQQQQLSESRALDAQDPADVENHTIAPQQEEEAAPDHPTTPRQSTPPPHPASHPLTTKSPTKSPSKSPTKPPAPPSPSQSTTLQTAIAHLRAHQAKTTTVTLLSTSTSTSTSPCSAPQKLPPRRHRPLGRASSNPSSLLTSISIEETCPSHHADEDDGDTSMNAKAVEWNPSQALGYDDPEAGAVRERLMRGALGGGDGAEEVEGVLRRVEGIGRVVDEGVGAGGVGGVGGEGRRRKRRGR